MTELNNTHVNSDTQYGNPGFHQSKLIDAQIEIYQNF